MKNTGARRIVVLGAAGAIDGSLVKQNPLFTWVARKLILEFVLKNPMASQRAQWNVLSGSGLDFTMVMPPKLSNGPDVESIVSMVVRYPKEGGTSPETTLPTSW